MPELTPLEETVAVQELIQMRVEQVFEQGELIGKIQLLQELLKRRRNSRIPEPRLPKKASENWRLCLKN